MKKKLFVIAVIVCAVAVLGMGTLAAFTANSDSKNIIQMGNVKIEVVERMTNPADPTGALIDYADPQERLLPGTTVSKIVSVKNVGDNPCFVRVNLALGAVNLASPTDLGDVRIVLNDNAGWVLNAEDGEYYYTAALAPGEETAPLMTGVELKKEMGNEYANATLNVDVAAQAVQSENNSEGVDFNAKFPAGWPAR